MYFALVYYPRIKNNGFHILRKKYEPYASLLPEHLAFIKPVPASIGLNKIEIHIDKILKKWKPFDIHLFGLHKSWDQWLLLILKEGNHLAIKLHDDLYSDILAPYLRKDLPYKPHIGLGLFSKEKYDVNNPTNQLSLDENKYQKAKAEFEDLSLDFWRTIDHLTLVKLNPGFTKCWNIKDFRI